VGETRWSWYAMRLGRPESPSMSRHHARLVTDVPDSVTLQHHAGHLALWKYSRGPHRAGVGKMNGVADMALHAACCCSVP
jgi:hypothetical protein